MVQANAELSGLEKASVLLMSLGSEASEEVLRKLSPEERDLLGAQIVRMRSVKSIVRERVLDEVSVAVMKGKVSDSEPLKWLETLDAERAAALVKGERPHTIALVLSHLSPTAAGSVLSCLDEKSRNAAAQCLARATQVSSDVVKTVDDLLRSRAFGAASEAGSNAAAPILKSIGQATARARESMLSAISGAHISPPSASAEITSLEHLVGLSDVEVQRLLGDVDLDDLCLALRVASDELRSAVLRVVPPSTARLLQERLESTAQVRIREIEIAQQRVLGAVRRAASGSLVASEAFD